MDNGRPVLVEFIQAWPHQLRSTRGDPGRITASIAGFSGAAVYRVDVDGRQYCLRGWPIDTKLDRLCEIHGVLRRAYERSICSALPKLYLKSSDGSYLHDASGRIWDLMDWMEGEPLEPPVDDSSLAEAMRVLAECHAAFAGPEVAYRVAPVVERRLEAIKATDPQRSWLRNLPGVVPAMRVEELDAMWPVLVSLKARLVSQLEQGRGPVRVQYVLRDVHREHLLRNAAGGWGLIDFDAVGMDSPIADLVRLLGTLVPDSPEVIHSGLRSYGRFRPLDDADWALALALDQATVWGALMYCLRWLAGTDTEDLLVRQRIAKRVELHAVRACALWKAR